VFVQRHGWSIKGLDHAGAGWNASATSSILKDQVPDFIQNMFEQRLGRRGLGLHELAVFAATLEHLVHNEAVGRLGSALTLHGLLPTGSMTSSEADEILDTYMMAYILGEDIGNMTFDGAQALTRAMPDIFLAWNDTQNFVREIRQKLTASDVSKEQDEISFALLVKIAETIGEGFGKFQDAECKGLKNALVNLEDRGSGRVRLSDFYKPAANGEDGSWQFQESVGYLRQLGTLDESNADEARVMIVNYLTSQANCIASSDYYSVCCIDECEDLFSHLEKSFAAPEATPARIAELVTALPSSSVSAPRELSATLRSRLDDIAVSHGGSVQLHGRLFAQWMHHAYPRECPYPHVSGTSIQENADGWSDGNGGDSVATQEEIQQFISVSNSSKFEPVEEVHDLMMWSQEEELLVVRPTLPPVAAPGLSGSLTQIVLFASLSALVFGMLRTMSPTSKAISEVPQKFMV
jgi:hypothetical protein